MSCAYITTAKQKLTNRSASPLNGEAAELWDKDPTLFKTKVMERHRDVEDD